MAREVYNVTAEFSFTSPNFEYKSPADIAARYHNKELKKRIAETVAKFLDENFPIEKLTAESACGIASDVRVDINVTFDDPNEQAKYHADSKYESDLEIAKMDRVKKLGDDLGVTCTWWSMGEKETNALLANSLFASGTIVLQYSDDPKLSVKMLSPTYQDLWRAADRLSDKSGDGHHIYLEAAKRKGNTNVYELWFGS